MRSSVPRVCSPRKAWLVGISSSLLLHLLLLGSGGGIALLISLPMRVPLISTESPPPPVEASWTLKSEFENTDVVSENTSTEVDHSPVIEDRSPQLANLIQQRLQQEQDQLSEETPEELRKKLERMGNRIEAVSSEKGVAEIATTLQGALGLSPRQDQATVSSEPKIPFDFSTAQIDDVRREVVNGKPAYLAILIDSRGATLETELEASEGEQLVETFALMKRYPLMKSVYRGVVMGLLDKMLASPKAHSPESPSPVPAEPPLP